MAEYLIQESTLTEIADAIRAKTGGTEAISVVDMASAIGRIPTGEKLDKILKYFRCTFDVDANEVVLYSIDYNKLYADNGSYDVVIPDKISGFQVVISPNS